MAKEYTVVIGAYTDLKKSHDGCAMPVFSIKRMGIYASTDEQAELIAIAIVQQHIHGLHLETLEITPIRHQYNVVLQWAPQLEEGNSDGIYIHVYVSACDDDEAAAAAVQRAVENLGCASNDVQVAEINLC